MQRALARHAKGNPDEPTKAGLDREIALREPAAALLQRQREVSYVGRSEGCILPNSKSGPLGYHNWLHRGWGRVLERTNVQPREGDAQKALRRTYITSALVCGRNAKVVSAEVGHTTLRMVHENYDSFIDPANWAGREGDRAAEGNLRLARRGGFRP